MGQLQKFNTENEDPNYIKLVWYLECGDIYRESN